MIFQSMQRIVPQRITLWWEVDLVGFGGSTTLLIRNELSWRKEYKWDVGYDI